MNKFRIAGLMGILAICVACQAQELPKNLGEAVLRATEKPTEENVGLVWDHVIEFCKGNNSDNGNIGPEKSDCSSAVIPLKKATSLHPKGELVPDHYRVTFWKENLNVQGFAVQVLIGNDQACQPGLEKFVPSNRFSREKRNEVLLNINNKEEKGDLVVGFCVGKEVR
jgi:hypothetical protein